MSDVPISLFWSPTLLIKINKDSQHLQFRFFGVLQCCVGCNFAFWVLYSASAVQKIFIDYLTVFLMLYLVSNFAFLVFYRGPDVV